MPETVTINREVDVEVKVYEVACSKKNHGTLAFTVEADRDGDLIVTVEPCDSCVTEAAAGA